MATKNMNTKTEQELLKDLRSKDGFIRHGAARNPNATTEVLLIAIKDKDESVRRAAAEHPNATPEVLLFAMEDGDEYVRSNAAGNPNATPEVLMVAMKDEKWNVRWNAARNPKIKSLKLSTDEWLELVAEDFFEGSLKNVPPHVKKDPRYKSSRLLSQLAKANP